MNIDEAIDDLYTILGQHNGEYMDYASYEAAVDNLNIISNFVAGTRWIPVSERLPEKDKSVFVFTDCGETDFAYIGYRTGHWFTNGMLLIPTVTHWIPLPEPPDVQSKENIDG